MRKLTLLWQALERIPGLCDVLASWQLHCGADYTLIQAHLRPTDDFGARYPCPHPHDADCPRAIVDYGDGLFAAVCSHPHSLWSPGPGAGSMGSRRLKQSLDPEPPGVFLRLQPLPRFPCRTS